MLTTPPAPKLRLLAALLTLCLGSAPPAVAQSFQGKPAPATPGKSAELPRHNILVILIDDIGVDVTGTYGIHPTAAPTPRLDQIAQQGLLFRNAHSAASCSPTRALIMTGHYADRNGVGVQIPLDKPTHQNGDWDPRGPLLPEILPRRYVKLAVGKWHLDFTGFDAPIDRGFDFYRGYVHNLKDHYNYLSTHATRRSSNTVPVTRYSLSQEIDDAIELIQTAPQHRPWFLWLGLHSAHAPWQAPPAHLHSFGDLSGASDRVIFRAMIEAVDREIGRLLDTLGPQVLAETTVIIAGDNGTVLAMQEAPEVSRGGKKQIYDGGTAVPLLVLSPKVVQPGREVLAPVDLVDLFDTILDLSGTPKRPENDSISLLPYFLSAATPALRDWTHARFHVPNGPVGDTVFSDASACVRSSRYKLIKFAPAAAAVEFFDLLLDPLETTNLAPGGNLSGLTPQQLAEFQALLDTLQGLGGP